MSSYLVDRAAFNIEHDLEEFRIIHCGPNVTPGALRTRGVLTLGDTHLPIAPSIGENAFICAMLHPRVTAYCHAMGIDIDLERRTFTFTRTAAQVAEHIAKLKQRFATARSAKKPKPTPKPKPQQPLLSRAVLRYAERHGFKLPTATNDPPLAEGLPLT